MSDTDALRDAKLARIDESHRCQPGDTALLVVDMQHGFLDEGASLEVPKGRDIVPAIQRLVECCRAIAVPVIFTEFVYATSIPCLRGDPFGPEHLPAVDGEPTGFGHASGNCLVGPGAGKGVEAAATVDALTPHAGELVVEGHTYDKFYGTHLDLALRSHNVRRLIVTGVTTDVCVLSTVVSASMRNYRVTIATDGVATIHDHIQQACLDIFENKFARLRTSAELVDELRSA